MSSWLLQVFDALSGVKRNLVLYRGQDADEIRQVIASSFERDDIVALQDPSTGTVLPLALFAQPGFSGSSARVFHTVSRRPVHASAGTLKRSQSVEQLLSNSDSDSESEQQPRRTPLEIPSLEETMQLREQYEKVYGPISFVDFLKVIKEAISSSRNDAVALPTPTDYDDSSSSESEEESEQPTRRTAGGDSEMSLEENVEELRLIFGLDNVSLDALLSLLPLNTRGRTQDDAFPPLVTREDFIEMFIVLKSLVPADPSRRTITDDEMSGLVGLLFNAMFHSSDYNVKAAAEKGLGSDAIHTPAMASGLCLICGGDPKDNLRTVFALYEERHGVPQHDGGACVRAYCLVDHLQSLFRVVFKLCGGSVRQNTPHSAESMGVGIGTRMIEGCPHRYGAGLLSFSEFYACAVTGFQQGLIAFHSGSEKLAAFPPTFERFSPEVKPPASAASASASAYKPRNIPPSLASFSDSSVGDATASAGGDDDDDDDEDGGGEGSENDDDDGPNLEDSLVAASLVDYDGGPLAIPRAARLLGLLKYSPQEVFGALQYAADEEATLAYASYQRLMGQLVGRHYATLSVLQRAVVDHVIAQLFSVFDATGSQRVKAVHVSWALLLFCGGDREQKARVAADILYFFKANAESTTAVSEDVTAQEMALCLSSLLKAVRGLDPTFLAPLSPLDVALEITMHAFSAAGLQWKTSAPTGVSGDGRKKLLDIDSFCHWFAVVLAQFETESAAGDSETSSFGDDYSRSSFDPLFSDALSYDPSNSAVSVGSGASAEADWVLPRRRFWGSDSQQSSPGRSSVESAVDLSFESRSTSLSGKLQQQQQQQQQQSHADSRFERRRPPPLTIDTDFTEEDEDEGAWGCSPDDEALAESTEDDGEEEEEEEEEDYLDLQQQGSMSVDKFQRLYGSDSRGGAAGGGREAWDYESSEYESRSATPASASASVASGAASDADGSEQGPAPSAELLELRRTRRLLGLDGYPAEDLMETLGERAIAGFLPYKAWLETIHLLTTLAGTPGQSVETVSLGRKLFDLFEPSVKYGEPCVAYVPFLLGLTALCSSPPEDKFTVAFALLDSDSDGWISAQELYQLISCFLRVTVACSALAAAKVASGNVSLDNLSFAVVSEAVKQFGTTRFSLDMVSEIACDSVELSQTTEW